MDYRDLGPDTLLQHLGEETRNLGSIAPPIFQSSNFAFKTVDDYYGIADNFSGEPPYVYSRVSNPTVSLAEKKIAALEKTERCLLTGSGMGAIAVALMANLEKGSHIVSVDTCYGPVREFLDQYIPRFGVTTTYVDGIDADEMIDAIKPETRVLYLESPSTFVFRLQDLTKICKAAKEKGVVTMIDNTYSTPIFQNPAEFGVDIVLHSASKYMAGHSDIVAGAICGSNERLTPILKYEINLFGNALAPFSAWLLTRGLRTLPIRMARAQETGNAVANWLESHRSVDVVNHVGLDSFPQKTLFQSQMRGSGGLLSFEPKDQNLDNIKVFTESLKLFTLGVSWGGFESLIVPLQVQPIGYPEQRQLIRLYTGLEDAKDLIADLKQAFEKSGL